MTKRDITLIELSLKTRDYQEVEKLMQMADTGVARKRLKARIMYLYRCEEYAAGCL